MKVKISRDYDMWESVLRNDIYNARRFGKVTSPCEYHKWEIVDVTFEELQELIKNGTAIMINC